MRTFFGLSPKHKPAIHTQLFEMVYHGHGFTWTELYNMPVWLRKFYYKKIEEALKKQKEAQEKQTKNTNKPKVSKPRVGPKF